MDTNDLYLKQFWDLIILLTVRSNPTFTLFTVSYGSWFDHVKGWTRQAEVLANVLYISYEEMWLVGELLSITVCYLLRLS